MKKLSKRFLPFGLALALCLSFAGCGSNGAPADDTDTPSIADITLEVGNNNAGSSDITLPEDPEDYSVYAGIWLCGAQYDYDYLKLDETGHWALYVGNDAVETGYLKYEPDYDCIYAYSDKDGSGCQFRLEDDELYFGSYGYFSYADGMTDISYDDGE